jgi:hypothetical protein
MEDGVPASESLDSFTRKTQKAGLHYVPRSFALLTETMRVQVTARYEDDSEAGGGVGWLFFFFTRRTNQITGTAITPKTNKTGKAPARKMSKFSPNAFSWAMLSENASAICLPKDWLDAVGETTACWMERWTVEKSTLLFK